MRFFVSQCQVDSHSSKVKIDCIVLFIWCKWLICLPFPNHEDDLKNHHDDHSSRELTRCDRIGNAAVIIRWGHRVVRDENIHEDNHLDERDQWIQIHSWLFRYGSENSFKEIRDSLRVNESVIIRDFLFDVLVETFCREFRFNVELGILVILRVVRLVRSDFIDGTNWILFRDNETDCSISEELNIFFS